MLKFPSWRKSFYLNLFGKKEGESKVLSESLFLDNQLKISIPKGKTLVPFKEKWISSDCGFAWY